MHGPVRLPERSDGTGAEHHLFSATLLPIRYYKEQLGGEKEDAAVYAKSVFLPEQRKVMIARDVTTKYTRRGAAEYEKIAAYIDSFISAKEGNYLLFSRRTVLWMKL